MVLAMEVVMVKNGLKNRQGLGRENEEYTE